MEVRLTSGLKAGEVIEVEDPVGRAFLASGKAELVVSEPVEAPEVLETPEKPATRKRRAKVDPETR
jgi:hypothetical protein